ncbi:MAG: VOC family protein [Proteobacteria bacterium]|nr:VOC family protein [Pseudomonadota bacterium]
MNDLPPAAKRIRIRQIAICTPDIWPVEQAVARTLEVTPVHRDKPGAPIWMFNSVIAIKDTFLEILQPERPEAPTQKFLDKQGGAAGYMLLLQVDDLVVARKRAEAAGVRVVLDMPKRQYHGVNAAAVHLHPADTGGVLTSFDWMEDWDSWAWGGQAWPWHQRTSVVSGITGAEISCADPDTVAARFSQFIGRGVSGDRSIALDDSSIRFIQGKPGARDRLTGIDMLASDRSRAGEAFDFARTTVRLV